MSVASPSQADRGYPRKNIRTSSRRPCAPIRIPQPAPEGRHTRSASWSPGKDFHPYLRIFLIFQKNVNNSFIIFPTYQESKQT